jgi:hypothetical protein
MKEPNKDDRINAEPSELGRGEGGMCMLRFETQTSYDQVFPTDTGGRDR